GWRGGCAPDLLSSTLRTEVPSHENRDLARVQAHSVPDPRRARPSEEPRRGLEGVLRGPGAPAARPVHGLPAGDGLLPARLREGGAEPGLRQRRQADRPALPGSLSPAGPALRRPLPGSL